MDAPHSLPVMVMRDCGECTACCAFMGVPELRKPAHAPCSFLREGHGCSIHPGRPFSCRHFDCLWRQGLLDEDARPDRVGMVLARQFQEATGRPTLTVYLHRADWRTVLPIQRMIGQITRCEPLVLISPTEKCIIVPEDEFDAVRDRLEAMPETPVRITRSAA